jgi:hypothetical protein
MATHVQEIIMKAVFNGMRQHCGCLPTNVGCSMTFFNAAASFDQMYKNGLTKAQDILQLIVNHNGHSQIQPL